MTLAKVTTVNNTTAVILPPEILARLGLSDGDTLQVRETPAGIELTTCPSEFDRQMTVAEAVMRDNREVLRKLAE